MQRNTKKVNIGYYCNRDGRELGVKRNQINVNNILFIYDERVREREREALRKRKQLNIKKIPKSAYTHKFIVV